MPWPTEQLLTRFSRPENAPLLRYLEALSPSAHSDLGILLFEAARELPGTAVFGPNPTACSYVFLHTADGVAFALAVDTNMLAFRLAEAERVHATKNGAHSFPDLGGDWIEIDPFDACRSRAETAALLRNLFNGAFRHASAAPS
jgi:hypothetical protein